MTDHKGDAVYFLNQGINYNYELPNSKGNQMIRDISNESVIAGWTAMGVSVFISIIACVICAICKCRHKHQAKRSEPNYTSVNLMEFPESENMNLNIKQTTKMDTENEVEKNASAPTDPWKTIGKEAMHSPILHNAESSPHNNPWIQR